ncbi:biotin transporter BioY [Haloarculaceae archaeon H-GB2-1]|nr:biotin transporter BioY [Haloarculaceae archaeon H-GB1-1]MEA5388277.1 biotin transporter BioY [Haloarculaceae archaeon H-GB11]MEA5406319.1 biotin transporter BioY [Haloarculaceae archaeon H-GB2-1]
MSQEYDSVELVGDSTVSQFARAVVVAALTAAFAQVSIPLPGLPAPVSFQVFAVYFAGLLLGPLWGGVALTLYLLVGVAGAPVFSNGAAGLGYALGPTGGYLLGFLVAAVLIGAIVHRRIEPRSLADVSLVVQAGALVAGLVAIYALGVPWLALSTGMGMTKAASVGMVVFVPGDLIKIIATLALVKGGHLALE